MMIKFLTGKPVSVIMVYAALLLLGLAAINRMPVSPLPPIEVPEISIQLYKKNASAAVIDQQVITPLRNWLQEVHGMVGFKSVARNESGLITIRFRFDTDIDLAVMEVNEKLDLAMSSLPRDIERPHVIKSSTADLPVFYIDMSYLSAKDTSVSKRLELSDFAEQTVKKRFEQLLGVAFVDITGLEKPEVEIIIDPVSIAAMQLKPADLKRELASLQLGGSSFQINDRGYEYNIRLEAPSLSSLNDLKQLLIKKGGRVFRLKDIATIHFIPQSAKGAFFFNGKRAVRMAILKHPDSEMDNLRSDVQKVMEDLRKDYPEIETQVTQDQTRLLEFSILNLKQDLIFGSLAACLLMAFFLRDLKAPLLIVLTIPVCLIVSLLFFNIFHLTINIISLSGLVLGVGLMVDNTIIVIDSITHFRKLNEGLAEACVNGVGQVIKPLITSAITTSSVFVPLVFLSGMAGALFFDQAVAIGICLAVSLAVSTTLLPVLYLLVYRKLDRRQLPAVSNGGNGGSFLSAYEKGFDWMFRYKRASIGIVVLLLGINVLIFRSLKKEKLPDLRQTDLQVDINWNAPVPLETKIRHAKKIILGLNEMVVQTHIEAGNQQYLLNNAQGSDKAETTLYLSLKPGVSPEIARLAIRRLIRAAYPRASYSVAPVKDIFEQIFESHEPDLVVQIRQLNGERVSPAFSSAFTGDLKKHFPAAVISDAGARSTTVIRADMEKAMLYDLEIEDIYEALREHAEGSEILSIDGNDRHTSVMVAGEGSSYERLMHITVRNKQGLDIPLGSILTRTSQEEHQALYQDKAGMFVPLEIQTNDVDALITYVNRYFSGKPAFKATYTGSYFSTQELIKEMAWVLLISILLLFFILSAQFGSLLQPLIVLIELPISISGALLLLYVCGSSLNLISMIGFIVMCGIVINDSILKIDTINRLRREGHSVKEAIHGAGLMRLNAILMTALTTVLSVGPFLIGSDIGSLLQRPLSLALIGGILIGTPVSLYFIPLVYWYFFHDKNIKE